MPAKRTEATKLDVIVVARALGSLRHPPPAQARPEVRAYEAASGVGGTWFWNRYPGCRCDCPKA